MAVGEILRAWGRPEPRRALRDDADALATIRQAGLQIHTVLASDLDEIFELDHPCLLEVRDAAGIMHWVALTELRPPEAFVTGVVERGPIGVSQVALESQWDGRAHVVWSPEVSVTSEGLLRSGAAGESVRWVQDALVELGYLAGLSVGDPAVYDASTRRGVQLFQKAQGLRQDGVAGPVTLMRLDDALGRRERPHLARGTAG